MSFDWRHHKAALWRTSSAELERGSPWTSDVVLRAVRAYDPVSLDDVYSVDSQKKALVSNTERFLNGQKANHALLWGAKGTGKSSLIKAVLNDFAPRGLRLIQVEKSHLSDWLTIADLIWDTPEYHFILYCDDLSFDFGESSYKGLKSLIEGSIEMPPPNMLMYATSNRRHLLPEHMHENLESQVEGTEIHLSEALEEKIALADRFGLRLGFYPFNQDAYLSLVDLYFPEPLSNRFAEREELHRLAIQFATARGGRSGRVAQQFHKHYSDDRSGRRVGLA
jgi:hypothetical protein